MLILTIIYFLSTIVATDYILTPKKNGGQRPKLLGGKIRGYSKFSKSNTEFAFAKDLSSSEINLLSKDFHVEKDEIVSINWHLDRIDQRYLPLDMRTYLVSNKASNIDVYIMDTGIDLDHFEFSDNNRTWGANFIDTINTDCHGHGTHVASLATGKFYGSSKGANLIAVKVLDCNGAGSYSAIISAINWITERASKSGKISVVNMSLGGPKSTAVDTAILNSFNSGVYYVVAAGNSNLDACNVSPAGIPSVITVAASDVYDTRASFSNYGKCIDVYSPGVNIKGAWPNLRMMTLSGTSMASPIVAGVLTNFLSKYGRSGYAKFNSSMTSNVIKSNKYLTRNKLVYYNYRL
jgi:subtilisin family serine protease